MSDLKLYKSYSFTDKDPIIDKLRTMIKDDGIEHNKLAEQSGVSTATLWNWFYGQTKRPQFATVAAVVRSMGYELEIVRGEKVIGVAPGRAPSRPKARSAEGQRLHAAHH